MMRLVVMTIRKHRDYDLLVYSKQAKVFLLRLQVNVKLLMVSRQSNCVQSQDVFRLRSDDMFVLRCHWAKQGDSACF